MALEVAREVCKTTKPGEEDGRKKKKKKLKRGSWNTTVVPVFEFPFPFPSGTLLRSFCSAVQALI